MLHEFLTSHRAELIALCQAKVASRRWPRPTEEELDHGVPLFIDQLTDTLRRELRSTPEIGKSATKHGNEMLHQGFSIDQVVHGYGDVCQSVTSLAIERDSPITTEEFRTLNKCLDDAIATAVTEHARQHERLVSDEHTERLGVLAHEMRNLLNAATLAYGAIAKGSVGVGGSTGAVLERSLTGLRRLVDRSLAEVRLEAGIQKPERVLLRELMEEARVSTLLATNERNIQFVVAPVEDGLFVEADRQTLSSVVANLLMNAFKFSRPNGTVRLTARRQEERILIEVADACGGLPPGKVQNLFRPFEQRGADRSGLGLGLAICLRGVEANGGGLHVHDIPGTGCIFTIDLPKP